MFLPTDIITSILKFIPIRESIHFSKISKFWHSVISENFMISVMCEHYGVMCDKTNIRDAIKWLGYDQTCHETHVDEFKNGNIFYSMKDKSFLIDKIGHVIKEFDEKVYFIQNTIVSHTSENDFTIYDSDGKLIESGKLDELVQFAGSGIFGTCYYISKTNIMFHILNHKEVSTYHLKVSDGKYLINADQQLITLDILHETIETRQCNGCQFLIDGILLQENKLWNLYNKKLTLLKTFKPYKILCHGNSFIYLHGYGFSVYKLQDSKCVKLYKFHYESWKKGWHRSIKNTMIIPSSFVMCNDDVIISSRNGKIFRIKNGNANIIAFIGMKISDVKILKTGKLMFYNEDDNSYNMINL